MEVLSKEQKEAKQVSEINNLRYAQKNGTAKMVKANKDTTIEIPEAAAEGYVFLMTTARHINQDLKSITEVKSLVPIHKANFDRMVAQGGFALFDDVKIVHDPREGARTDYKFKIEHVSSASIAETPSKSADMTAINEARKGLEAQKTTLENKQAELIDREARLKAQEEDLAKREAALKDDGSASQTK